MVSEVPTIVSTSKSVAAELFPKRAETIDMSYIRNYLNPTVPQQRPSVVTARQQSLEPEIFPAAWKIFSITPIFNTVDLPLVSNYMIIEFSFFSI